MNMRIICSTCGEEGSHADCSDLRRAVTAQMNAVNSNIIFRTPEAADRYYSPLNAEITRAKAVVLARIGQFPPMSLVDARIQAARVEAQAVRPSLPFGCGRDEVERVLAVHPFGG